jgi:N-acylneuraminate cytidylyltransferase
MNYKNSKSATERRGEDLEKKSIAIITARGGSKRIPGKNIKSFCGKPILAYSIEAAKESGIFDEIMVSTDSDEIAAVAAEYGAKVPFMRSARTSDDYATTADVLLEVLDEYEKRGETFQYMSCIYPTAPFVTGERLREAFSLLQQSGAIEVMPVVPFSYPPQRGYVLKGDVLDMKWKENLNARSQDLETLYHDSGQFYFWNVGQYLEKEGQISTGIVPVVLDDLEVQDIDNETDWKLAELKYQLLHTQQDK